jgi:integrase
VGRYLERWLTDSVRDTVKATTYESYERLIRLHLVPTLGRLKLKNLTTTHVRGLYREKLDHGLSPTSVQRVHALLHKALKPQREALDRVVLKLVDEESRYCVDLQ